MPDLIPRGSYTRSPARPRYAWNQPGYQGQQGMMGAVPGSERETSIYDLISMMQSAVNEGRQNVYPLNNQQFGYMMQTMDPKTMQSLVAADEEQHANERKMAAQAMQNEQEMQYHYAALGAQQQAQQGQLALAQRQAETENARYEQQMTLQDEANQRAMEQQQWQRGMAEQEFGAGQEQQLWGRGMAEAEARLRELDAIAEREWREEGRVGEDTRWEQQQIQQDIQNAHAMSEITGEFVDPKTGERTITREEQYRQQMEAEKEQDEMDRYYAETMGMMRKPGTEEFMPTMRGQMSMLQLAEALKGSMTKPGGPTPDDIAGAQMLLESFSADETDILGMIKDIDTQLGKAKKAPAVGAEAEEKKDSDIRQLQEARLVWRNNLRDAQKAKSSIRQLLGTSGVPTEKAKPKPKPTARGFGSMIGKLFRDIREHQEWLRSFEPPPQVAVEPEPPPEYLDPLERGRGLMPWEVEQYLPGYSYQREKGLFGNR